MYIQACIYEYKHAHMNTLHRVTRVHWSKLSKTMCSNNLAMARTTFCPTLIDPESIYVTMNTHYTYTNHIIQPMPPIPISSNVYIHHILDMTTAL